MMREVMRDADVRLSPAAERTPGGRRFLTAEWRWLAMLNYRVPPELLAPLVPAGTELDLWRGEALVSVVGFRFLGTRLLGLAVPRHRDFDEVNLRFYVRRHAPDGRLRRGVVFVREVVPRRAIAIVARLAYNEPYVALPMRSEVRASPAAVAPSVRYEWRLGGRWRGLALDACDEAGEAAPGSEEEFVTEHYWGYTRQRDGGTVEYRVEHPRWRVWRAAEARLDDGLAPLYGPELARRLAAPPASAFLADGSPVTVYAPRRIEVP